MNNFAYVRSYFKSFFSIFPFCLLTPLRVLFWGMGDMIRGANLALLGHSTNFHPFTKNNFSPLGYWCEISTISKKIVKFPKFPDLNFMEISGNFRRVFLIMKNWLTRVSFRKFHKISGNFKKFQKYFQNSSLSFHFSKIYGNVKTDLANWCFMECFNVPHNPERCEYSEK